MRGRLVILLAVAAALLLLAAPAAPAIGIDVTHMSPDIGVRGSTVECSVFGSFLVPGHETGYPEFTLTRGGAVITSWTSALEHGASIATATFTIPPGAPTGLYRLNAAQTSHHVVYTDYANDAFEVVHGPWVARVDPPAIVAGAGETQIAVFGSGFFHLGGPLGRHTTVLVDGRPVPTVVQSAQMVVGFLPAMALARPGVLHIGVVNPGAVPAEDLYSNTVDLPVYIPPVITAISPTWAAPGGPSFTLDVTGANFHPGWGGAVVRWNNLDLVTTRISTSLLRAAVPAQLIATSGTASITVRNGGPGGPLSNAVLFTIALPTPVLTGLSPASVWAGYVKNDLVLAVNGSNFYSGARIALNGVDKTNTTFVGATQLTVPLAAADIATAGTVQVSVKNPPFPPGAPSATTLPLTVAAETTTPQVTIAGADSSWHNSPVLLSFAASDSQSGVQKVQYMAPPAVPAWTDGTSYTVPTTTQGAIAVSAQALDWCNKVGTATATVYIDTTQPRTRTLDDCTVKKGHNARLKFRVEEPSNLSPKAKVTIRILRADGSQAKKLEYPSVPMNRDRVAGFTCNLKKGTYTWEVYATDMAGNTQANIARAQLYVE